MLGINAEIDQWVAEHVHAGRKRARRPHGVEPLGQRLRTADARRSSASGWNSPASASMSRSSAARAYRCTSARNSSWPGSQDRHRVDRAAGALGDAQRCHREQELPPPDLGAPFAIAGQAHVVDEVQAHGGDADLVDRERPVGDGQSRASDRRCRRCRELRPRARAATAGTRGAARPSRRTGRAEAGAGFLAPRSRARCRPASHGCRRRLRRTRDPCAGWNRVLEEIRAAQPRNVEEHAPSDHAVGHRHHAVCARPVAANVRRGPAAVHLAPNEHVRERVDMRDGEPVHVESRGSRAPPRSRGCRCCRGRRPPPACDGAPDRGCPATVRSARSSAETHGFAQANKPGRVADGAPFRGGCKAPRSSLSPHRPQFFNDS